MGNRRRIGNDLIVRLAKPDCGDEPPRRQRNVQRAIAAMSAASSYQRVVHKQIHQDRADHAALWRTPRARQTRPIRSFERRSQPPLDVQQKPALLDMAPHRVHQQRMVNLVECCPDVKLNNPVVFPTARMRHGNRLFSRLAGPIPTGILIECSIECQLDR
jgi:hypothetical protein